MTTGADILVDRCLLQPVEDRIEYRLHDLVLDYLQLAIRLDCDLARLASSRQAAFLGRVAVLRTYAAGGDTVLNGGMYALLALWNSAKKVDETLSVEKYYKASLKGVGVADFPTWQNAANVLSLLVSYGILGVFSRGGHLRTLPANSTGTVGRCDCPHALYSKR